MLSVSLSNSSLKKKRTRSIFSSLFCCLRSYDADTPATPNNNSSPLPPPVEENGGPPKVRRHKHLLYTRRDPPYQTCIDSQALSEASASHCHVCFDRRHHNCLSVQTVSRVSIIVHLSCGSAPHFLCCLFPLCSSLMYQCDQVEVIPVPSVCMTPLHCRLSVCVLSHAAWSVTLKPALRTVMHFSWWMHACMLCILHCHWKPTIFPYNLRNLATCVGYVHPWAFLNCEEHDCLCFIKMFIELYFWVFKVAKQSVLALIPQCLKGPNSGQRFTLIDGILTSLFYYCDLKLLEIFRLFSVNVQLLFHSISFRKQFWNYLEGWESA